MTLWWYITKKSPFSPDFERAVNFDLHELQVQVQGQKHVESQVKIIFAMSQMLHCTVFLLKIRNSNYPTVIK